MEENTQTTTTQGTENSSSGNTMMFVIGAIVLAGILGYVIFSSANNDNSETEETPVVAEDNTMESTDENAMVEETLENPAETTDLDMQIEQTDPNAMETDEEEVSDIKVFEIEAGAFYYRPNVITVNKGDTVRIIMNSVDMMHDFNIDELGVDMEVVQSGNTGTVEFTVDEAGSYEFYCSVGQHRANGQVGTLVVQDL